MRAVLFAVIAGCGGAKHVAEPVGNRAAPPPKPACSDGRIAAIEKHLGPRWNSARLSVVRCTPGRFPTPGYFIEISVQGDHWSGLMADDGETMLVDWEHANYAMKSARITDCATNDLDGDGVDEIIQTWRHDSEGGIGSDSWLEIVRFTGRRLASTPGCPHTSVYHPDLGGCTAAVRIAGRTLVITVDTIIGIPPSDCLAYGTHTYALENQRLVKTR